MRQRNFRPRYFFNNEAYFLDFCAQNYPLVFFSLNPLKHQRVQHFGILNYQKKKKKKKKTIKKASVKFKEDLLYFRHFMQIFVFAQNQ